MALYRGQSPIFVDADLPIPNLRKVKPLPKRQRTIDDHEEAIQQLRLSETLANMSVSSQDVPVVPAAVPAANADTHLLAMPPSLGSHAVSPGPGPGTTTTSTPFASAEDILSHANSLSAQMALQQYYLPILGGMQELFRPELGGDGPLLDPTDLGLGSFNVADLRLVPESLQTSFMPLLSSSLSTYQAQLAGSGLLRREDEGRSDGDYADHLQQTGKTKKRKVPVNAATFSRIGETVDLTNALSAEELIINNDSSSLTMDEHHLIGSSAWGSMSTINSNRRRRIPQATLAGLQHKEMLNSRKRQLAAVLGVLAHGDTLALDQAILASYSSASATGISKDIKTSVPVRIRLSCRRGPRLARMFQASCKLLPTPVPTFDVVAFPQSDFTFAFPSPSKEMDSLDLIFSP
jgi:hypothetical protein